LHRKLKVTVAFVLLKCEAIWCYLTDTLQQGNK